jgi:F420-dependent oxidoreductase-like protein
MAQQALTAQSAAEGRFTLGIGLSHESMVSGALGIPFERPAQHMREYLSVLLPLLAGEGASVSGDVYRVQTRLGVSGVPPVPVVVAALGPLMLKLAGSLTDGTITSWVGPRTLERHIVPRITKAAEAAGRQAPRVVVGLPISLTNDADGARDRFAPQVTAYGALPSYAAMFEIEGVDRPADIALFGDDTAIGKALDELADAGATDFQAQIVAAEPGSATRTLEYLASRAG